MLQLRNVYNKVFPLNTFRRFLSDQIFSWSIHLGYYTIITVSILSSVAIITFLIGYPIVKWKDLDIMPNKTAPTQIDTFLLSISIGILTVCFGYFIGVVIWFTLYCIYEMDYKVWKERQNLYIDELINGKKDLEAINIPITLTFYQRINYFMCALGSRQRYFSRLIIIIIIILIFLMIHAFVSINIFPNFKMHWVAKWYLSASLQFIIGLILYGIYSCIKPSCVKEFERFKSQSLSAESHDSN
jgi:phosphatidylglycerophosphatase A